MESGRSDKEATDPAKNPPARRPSKSNLDLDAAYRSLKFESREMPEEMVARLRKEARQAHHELWKEKIIVLATLAGLTAIGGTCLVVAMGHGSPEDKKWAMSILASIVSVGVGYLGGRASKSN